MSLALLPGICEELGSDGNLVGLVYVAVAARDGRSRIARREFRQRGKDEICAAAMEAALSLLEELMTAQVS